MAVCGPDHAPLMGTLPVHILLEPDEVHQALGMVSEQARTGIEDAYARLSREASAAGRSLVAIAVDVVSGRLRCEGDPTG